MQIVCLGLLLFSLTWAAPASQPQTEKTKQDCVEEQKITYKGHHERQGYYMYKYIHTSSGRKNQTDIKQEEKNKDNIASHHSGKKRNQKPAPKENMVQKRGKNLSLLEANDNSLSSKSKNPLEKRQTMNEDYSISNKQNTHSDLKVSTYHESTEDRDDAISQLHGQEEYGATVIRNMRHMMEPWNVLELSGKENRENKLRNVLNTIPAGAPSKDKKNHQRDLQAHNIPVKNKSTHHIAFNAVYSKRLPKVKKIPSAWEGSGYPDLQKRGDNDIVPFSGDGQPFKDILDKGEAIGPDTEGADIQVEFSSPSEAETVNPDARGPGYNEIPEEEENGRDTIGTRDETAKEADGADVSLVGGSNDITGSTDFKELPGKEGNRVDASSQNAHQGKVEFHYPPVPSKEKRKEGSSEVAESADHNEIPKHGKGSSRKGTEHSVVSEKQRLPHKGKSQGRLIPSHGLNNEIRNEIGPHDYTPHRQNNSTRNKGMPQRKRFWGYRKPHYRRRFSAPKKHDSSESSDSGSSSESDGD
ncbi:matrix extracellular phosphoglycoprotein isoform X1 [Manis javanica]|uniref:matrix extracellular phosphoglycoprotein isoform X1 n=2 Tax=Manis javanica TaxID=9974 RepID=UPI003C6CFEAA